MTSRFIGRDYSTLRSEIIDFLKQKLPTEWDDTNLSDPVVIFAESLAKMGDQLHYTIDELRRECDMATAKRASSIYSYAMREGYKMMLPRGSFGTILVNSEEQSDRIEININKFDEIKSATGDTLIVAKNVSGRLHAPVDQEYADALLKSILENPDDVSKRGMYSEYVNTISERTIRIPVVLGSKETFNFTFNDINNDSTVDLPDSIIDRDLISLTTTSTKTVADDNGNLEYVDDIIGSGFKSYSYTLSPKFIGGAITLCIEFPTNYKDLFDSSDTFIFTYVKIRNSKIDDTEDNANAINLDEFISPTDDHKNDQDISEGIKYEISLADGIKGYSEYENPNVTRENYKKYVQNYSALLTKDDYISYIKAKYSQHCQVFDHSDNYRTGKVPEGTELLPRTIYIITDSDYDGRAELWKDLVERSSRSDCVIPMPYGKDPYTIIVKADCYLLGTSISSIATEIKTALLKYYAGSVGEKTPETSMINYLVHRASDKVIRMDSCIVRDSTYGTIDTTFKDVNTLSNDDIDLLYNAITNYNSLDSGMKEMHDSYLMAKPDYNPPVSYEYFNKNKDTEFVDYENYDDYLYKKYRDFYIIEYSLGSPGYDSYQSYYVANYGYSKYTLNEYRPFPDEFTKIYFTNGEVDSERVIDDPLELVNYQIDYGLLDRPEWDIKDTEIFSVTDGGDTGPWATGWLKFDNRTDDEPNNPYGFILKENTSWVEGSEPVMVSVAVDVEDGSNYYIAPRVDDSTKRTDMLAYGTELYNVEAVTYTTHSVEGCSIDPYYIKHHYMVPVLNNVVVMIKAVTR